MELGCAATWIDRAAKLPNGLRLMDVRPATAHHFAGLCMRGPRHWHEDKKP